MSSPRRLPKHQAHTACRRTEGRRFFLKPTPRTNQVLEYALLLAASRRRGEVEVSAFCALSNHYHCQVSDLLGGADSLVPKFFADLNSLLARALNAQLGRGGTFWDGGSYDTVEIHGYEASIAQWVYVAGQAVAAGLVERPEDWHGLTWLPEDIGTTKRARRPDHAFFGTRSSRDLTRNDIADDRAKLRAQDLAKRLRDGDRKRGRTRHRRRQLTKEHERREEAKRNPNPHAPKSSTLPEWVSYTIPVPTALKGLPLTEARQILRAALNDYVAAIHAQRREERLQGFLGMAEVLAQDPLKAAGDSWPTFGRNPRIACTGHSTAERVAIYDALVQWRADHSEGVRVLLDSAPWRARFPAGAHGRARELRRILAARQAQAPPRAA